jgi:DNA polymerase III epsilon subunit-like protein
MKQGKYLLMDTEFSGPHPEKHGMTEIAVAALDEKFEVLDTYQTYVCPPVGFEMDEESMHVSGITLEQINSGISYSELCEKLIDFIKTNFEGKPVAAGQFYPAEFMFLNYIFGVCGYGRLLMDEYLGNDFLDTKVIVNYLNAKARLSGEEMPFPITSLSKPGGLKEKLGITGFQAHTALGDVMATREVLIRLMQSSNS